MAAKHWHLITYDVHDSKRLRKVAKLLEGYGARLQYSVFRCRLNNDMLQQLHWKLNKVMSEDDDLLIIPLCLNCASKVPEHSTGDQTTWAEPPATFKII